MAARTNAPIDCSFHRYVAAAAMASGAAAVLTAQISVYGLPMSRLVACFDRWASGHIIELASGK